MEVSIIVTFSFSTMETASIAAASGRHRKVISDSFSSVGVYKFNLWPKKPTLDGYKAIISTSRLYRPFVN